jgi:hypothetical protein
MRALQGKILLDYSRGLRFNKVSFKLFRVGTLLCWVPGKVRNS